MLLPSIFKFFYLFCFINAEKPTKVTIQIQRNSEESSSSSHLHSTADQSPSDKNVLSRHNNCQLLSSRLEIRKTPFTKDELEERKKVVVVKDIDSEGNVKENEYVHYTTKQPINIRIQSDEKISLDEFPVEELLEFIHNDIEEIDYFEETIEHVKKEKNRLNTDKENNYDENFINEKNIFYKAEGSEKNKPNIKYVAKTKNALYMEEFKKLNKYSDSNARLYPNTLRLDKRKYIVLFKYLMIFSLNSI